MPAELRTEWLGVRDLLDLRGDLGPWDILVRNQELLVGPLGPFEPLAGGRGHAQAVGHRMGHSPAPAGSTGMEKSTGP